MAYDHYDAFGRFNEMVSNMMLILISGKISDVTFESGAEIEFDEGCIISGNK